MLISEGLEAFAFALKPYIESKIFFFQMSLRKPTGDLVSWLSRLFIACRGRTYGGSKRSRIW